MNRKGLVGIVLLIAWATGVSADGFIILPPPPGPGPAPTPLAVRYHRVDVEVRQQAAVTRIDQVFHNPNDRILEGTYLFPLPPGAAISEFSLFIDGEETPAELLEAEQARRIYEDIVRRMRDPALLEYAGRGLFRARIYPLPARGDRRIRLSYTEVLDKSDGLIRYRYPLNTEKFSSRPLEEVQVTVDWQSRLPLRSIYSPSHEVEVVRRSPHQAVVAYEDHDVKPDRDFILYAGVAPDQVGLGLLAHRPGPEEDGHFLLVAAPDPDFRPEEILPKDMVLVLDTSGSMRGRKIEQARRALLYCLDNLDPRDRFALVRFSTDVEPFRPILTSAGDTDALRGARRFVDGFRARGGTNIDGALQTALSYRSGEKRSLMVVFLTDGLPTVGERDPDRILEGATSRAGGDERIFVFGVGHDVNTRLLDLLAERHRGSRTYVRPEEEIEEAVAGFYHRVASPVLTDLVLEMPGTESNRLHPTVLPDLFARGQLVILGRYRHPGRTVLTLRGRGPGGIREFRLPVDLPARTDDNGFVPQLWATRRVGFLLDQIRLHGADAELREEIVRLARRYGIVTPYTSLLVLEDQERPGAAPMERDAFVDLAGRSMAAGVPSAGEPVSEEKARQTLSGVTHGKAMSGSVAFEGTREAEAMRRISVPPVRPDTGSGQRSAGGRTFYLKEGVWVDGDYRGGEIRQTLRFGTDGYFEFLRENLELAPILALGTRVILVHQGIALEVVPG